MERIDKIILKRGGVVVPPTGELLRATVQDTEEAESPPSDLEAVYRAHAAQVARWAGRLGGPSIDAEDVTQEVFLTVQRLLPGFRGDSAITTWLYRITANEVRYRRRKERLFRWLGLGGDAQAARMPAQGPTPVEELEQRQAAEQVYRVLDAMDDRYRSVLILFEIEKLPGDEIARLLGVKATTLRVWLHRARAEFAARLAKLQGKGGSV
jgi:RNA polymerase sigma-70 factor (ECF subfamily)